MQCTICFKICLCLCASTVIGWSTALRIWWRAADESEAIVVYPLCKAANIPTSSAWLMVLFSPCPEGSIVTLGLHGQRGAKFLHALLATFLCEFLGHPFRL